VESLLASLSLSELLPLFEAKGYRDLGRIVDMGLTDQDLDFIGVEQPLARRLLRSAVEANFAEHLQIAMLGHVQLGDSIIYKCVPDMNAHGFMTAWDQLISFRSALVYVRSPLPHPRDVSLTQAVHPPRAGARPSGASGGRPCICRTRTSGPYTSSL
jgi:hypothetical protein